jgi:hypothetical protein
MLIWSLIIFFMILAINVVKNASKEEKSVNLSPGWIVVIIIALVIVYVGIMVTVLPMPAHYTATQIRLQAEYTYMENHAQKTDSSIVINNLKDTSDNKKGSDNASKDQTYWGIKQMQLLNEIQKYDEGVAFWKSYPNLDLFVWGFPRVGNKIAKLPLIQMKIFSVDMIGK